MLFDTDGTITTVIQEGVSPKVFLENLNEAYSKVQQQHLVLNLSPLGNLTESEIAAFQHLSDTHRGKGKSFVLVSDALDYEDIPEDLCLVPTLKEAMDIIEMEEIERDLGF